MIDKDTELQDTESIVSQAYDSATDYSEELRNLLNEMDLPHDLLDKLLLDFEGTKHELEAYVRENDFQNSVKFYTDKLQAIIDEINSGGAIPFLDVSLSELDVNNIDALQKLAQDLLASSSFMRTISVDDQSALRSLPMKASSLSGFTFDFDKFAVSDYSILTSTMLDPNKYGSYASSLKKWPTQYTQFKQDLGHAMEAKALIDTFMNKGLSGFEMGLINELALLMDFTKLLPKINVSKVAATLARNTPSDPSQWTDLNAMETLFKLFFDTDLVDEILAVVAKEPEMLSEIVMRNALPVIAKVLESKMNFKLEQFTGTGGYKFKPTEPIALLGAIAFGLLEANEASLEVKRFLSDSWPLKTEQGYPYFPTPNGLYIYAANTPGPDVKYYAGYWPGWATTASFITGKIPKIKEYATMLDSIATVVSGVIDGKSFKLDTYDDISKNLMEVAMRKIQTYVDVIKRTGNSDDVVDKPLSDTAQIGQMESILNDVLPNSLKEGESDAVQTIHPKGMRVITITDRKEKEKTT